MDPTPAQAAYLGQLKAQLSDARLAPYLQASSSNLLGALGRYFWNIELCQAHYPLVNAIEVALRNNLDRAFGARAVLRRTQHVHSWLDSNPSIVKHSNGLADVARAKSKLPRWDASAQAFRHPPPAHGDLLAALDFGFWTGLLESVYDELVASPGASHPSGGTLSLYEWP